ncbi:hypothetical protein K438DRAFT_1996665 [Mycena galopus ATCC 62051]|nr:hypothetical protein K438DRAFT_1996665 [Mycena galopus ATCC 62051]
MELAILPEYSARLLVKLPAHPDVSVSHPVGTPESSVHLRSPPAFILCIPAIFEHSRPTLFMTYVLGDAPFLRMNFRPLRHWRSTPSSSGSYPDLLTITIRPTSGFPIILRPSITLPLPSLLAPSSINPRQSSGLFPDIPMVVGLLPAYNRVSTTLRISTSAPFGLLMDLQIRCIQHGLVTFTPWNHLLGFGYSNQDMQSHPARPAYPAYPAYPCPWSEQTSTSVFLHSANSSPSRPFTSLLPPLDSSGGFAETTSSTIGSSGLSAIMSSVLRSNSPKFSGSFRLWFPVPDTTDDNGHSSGKLPTSEIYFALAVRPILLGPHVSGIALDLRHSRSFRRSRDVR